MKPIVAIVGRPNVGKSTFFNKVTGKKISIVENTPGVTRDRIYSDAEWCGKQFTLIDTGGLELKSTDEMWSHIGRQVDIAIDTADVIIFFMDGKAGLTSSDYDVADKLRRSHKPIVLAVNKLENYDEALLSEFYSLGLGTPFGISAEHIMGVGDLLDEVTSYFDKIDEGELSEYTKIAIVGKPNSGKSSIVNRLLGEERTIVSSVAGTTRDAIDSPFELNGKKYMLIDTAGIRKKRSVDTDVEYYSVLRSLAAIRRADVCLIMIDASEGLSEQDVKICGYVDEQNKPSVIAMNKWDLVEKDDKTIEKFNKDLVTDLAFMDYFKSIYVSAKTGLRIEKIFSLLNESIENSRRRITTGVFNEMLMAAVRSVEPVSRGKRLKILYGTQASVSPPTFVVYVNEVESMHFTYKKYLENCIRRAVDFSGTPIRIIVRRSGDKGDEN